MKKKLLSAMLSVAMVSALLVGCGSTATNTADTAAPAADTAAPAADTAAPAADAAADTTADAAADEGKVLNIYCWNEEFKSRLTDHYPGYEEVDATHGKIGDVDVVWTITPSDDNAYQNKLDEVLPGNADAAADDRVDLFLVEADYALKYVDEDVTLPVADLGVTDADTANQYKYTKDIVTDSNGQLKGVSWQGCPGVLIYNREAAKEVLGSDDPDAVQEYVKDWDTFLATAETLKAAGYKITATANDTYRVFSDNAGKVVENGAIKVDDTIKKWVDMSKAMVDAGETGTGDLWGDEWSAGFYPDGKVFCYFGPAWLIDFCMAADDEASIAHAGGWGATTGPQGFSWGGTWICAANGTDNAALVGDIMKKLTCTTDIMLDIVKADNDFVNDKPAMEQMAADTSYGDAVLGGQNALAMFCEGAEKIDRSNMTIYDQGYTESFQQSMKEYFEGNATYEEALDLFITSVTEKYPELTY